LLTDVQNERDQRGWPINQVGVKNVKYPITVLDKQNARQSTIATFNMYVNLPHDFRGTHMSRFIEVLEAHRGEISLRSIEGILVEMKQKLKAKSSYLEITFPYFIEKKAPVSRAKSLMEYECKFIAEHNSTFHLTISIKIPVTTLCPCSKAISSRGAHNQRGMVTLTYKSKKLIWIEDIIKIVENCASGQLYTLLKRPDERFVTEHAYDHPAFVEDVVRNVAIEISKLTDIEWFKVETENFESIHNHNAYAMIHAHNAPEAKE
jgi:GTP cyclohydrolase I